MVWPECPGEPAKQPRQSPLPRKQLEDGCCELAMPLRLERGRIGGESSSTRRSEQRRGSGLQHHLHLHAENSSLILLANSIAENCRLWLLNTHALRFFQRVQHLRMIRASKFFLVLAVNLSRSLSHHSSNVHVIVGSTAATTRSWKQRCQTCLACTHCVNRWRMLSSSRQTKQGEVWFCSPCRRRCSEVHCTASHKISFS
jgi:hypothetical protein